MVEMESKAIHLNNTYYQFIEWNTQCLSKKSPEELVFFRQMCNKIMRREVLQMDFEDCAVWETCCLFFGIDKNLVVIHSR
jgi:hypothetical protein